MQLLSQARRAFSDEPPSLEKIRTAITPIDYWLLAYFAALVAYTAANLVSFDFSISGIWFFLLLALAQIRE